MKQFKLFGWASILILLVFASCREDIYEDDSTKTDPQPEIRVEASLFGQVIDENQVPLENVSVKVGNDEVLTDENGLFEFESKVIDGNGTLVRAEKFGYYLGLKMFNPTVGNKSYVPIQLLTKEVTGKFVANTGGTISTTDNLSLVFGPNSIVYENGTAYNGEVTVYAKWLDPTSDLIEEQMPGDLRATNKENEIVQLATYGMVAVELESTSGADLNLKDGSTATLSMPVPDEIVGNAPGTIPLWSFDEETGYWVEESTAVLEGGKYVGEVPHFSFWNCDAPFPVVELEGTLEDTNGNPLAWTKVTIENDNTGVGFGWTNDTGQFSGKVPQDLPLTIKVYDKCNAEVYSAEIGPFSSAVVLDPIVVTSIEAFTISGTLLKCDGTPVTNGYAHVDGFPFSVFAPVDANGDFSTSTLLCENITASLTGYDIDELLKSDPITINATSTGGLIDLGTIDVCQTITEIIHIEVPDLGIEKDYFVYSAFGNPTDTLGINIGAESDSSEFSLTIDAADFETGLKDVLYLNFFTLDGNNPTGNGDYLYCYQVCGQADVTTNDGTGGLFQASYTGEVQNEITSLFHTIEVTISVYLE